MTDKPEDDKAAQPEGKLAFSEDQPVFKDTTPVDQLVDDAMGLYAKVCRLDDATKAEHRETMRLAGKLHVAGIHEEMAAHMRTASAAFVQGEAAGKLDLYTTNPYKINNQSRESDDWQAGFDYGQRYKPVKVG